MLLNITLAALFLVVFVIYAFFRPKNVLVRVVCFLILIGGAISVGAKLAQMDKAQVRTVQTNESHPPAMLRCSNGVHYCMLVIALPQEELVGVDSKNSILLANADTGVLKVGFFYRKSGLNDPWAPISAKVAPSWRESQLEVDGHPVDLGEVKFVQIVTVGRPDEVFKTVAVRHK